MDDQTIEKQMVNVLTMRIAQPRPPSATSPVPVAFAGQPFEDQAPPPPPSSPSPSPPTHPHPRTPHYQSPSTSPPPPPPPSGLEKESGWDLSAGSRRELQVERGPEGVLVSGCALGPHTTVAALATGVRPGTRTDACACLAPRGCVLCPGGALNEWSTGLTVAIDIDSRGDERTVAVPPPHGHLDASRATGTLG